MEIPGIRPGLKGFSWRMCQTGWGGVTWGDARPVLAGGGPLDVTMAEADDALVEDPADSRQVARGCSWAGEAAGAACYGQCCPLGEMVIA